MRRNIVPPQFTLNPTPNQRHKAFLLAITKNATIALLHVHMYEQASDWDGVFYSLCSYAYHLQYF